MKYVRETVVSMGFKKRNYLKFDTESDAIKHMTDLANKELERAQSRGEDVDYHSRKRSKYVSITIDPEGNPYSFINELVDRVPEGHANKTDRQHGPKKKR